MNETVVHRALISTSDKTGVVEFAKKLVERGIEILSTGGTAKTLRDAGLGVLDVSDYTGFPEMMSGRLKTLHPKVHGGILGRRDVDSEVMHKHEILDIDLVVVNLYPFQETVAKDATFDDAIEQIDVGGPTMIRAAAKNMNWVTVVTDHRDYDSIISLLTKHDGAIPLPSRKKLAQKAFQLLSQYDGAIANYLSSQSNDIIFKENLNLCLTKVNDLRYGENPHQKAALYSSNNSQDSLVGAKQIQGKALSYNNLLDTDAALSCVKAFSDLCCTIVKHANPCGVALGDTLLEAYEKAYESDPLSAFGGIIAFNDIVDSELMDNILARQFVEVIIAPKFSLEAIHSAAQKPNLRLLEKPLSYNDDLLQFRSIEGGMLVQEQDFLPITPEEWKVVSKTTPTHDQMIDLQFAWQLVRFVKSNAIVYAQNTQTFGIGAGQMSRVFSSMIAGEKAKAVNFALDGAVMASDAFFPFSDNIAHAAELGIKAIISPGGSKRDQEVIDEADKHGISMIFTGKRHFRH